MIRIGFALMLATAAIATLRVVPAHSATFDGHWSVLIVTEKGECDRAYRYELRVNNGVVVYEGEAAVDVTGKVDPGGSVRVRVKKGEQHADAVGRLSAKTGTGTWTGKSSTGACSGTWEAERRG